MLKSIEVGALAAITASSLLYSLIWLRPRFWLAVTAALAPRGFPPTRAMAFAAHALKLLQFALIAYRFFEADPRGAALFASPLWRSLPGLLLVGAGQALNASVYAALGEAGVYYGVKLGAKVNWVTGWPYSYVRDPQYVGALLSLGGAYVLGVVSGFVCVGWALNYFYLMALESNVFGPAAAARTRGRRRPDSQRKAA